jgi:hypothetical protein
MCDALPLPASGQVKKNTQSLRAIQVTLAALVDTAAKLVHSTCGDAGLLDLTVAVGMYVPGLDS